MKRRILILALLALAACGPRDANAFTAVVPDDYPGIQAAHDAGATVIQVRAGVYPGSIVISQHCTIEPVASTSPGFGPAVPWIQGRFTIDNVAPPTPDVVVRGMRISGLVTCNGGMISGSNTFLDCRMDSGVVLPGGAIASIRNCLVTTGGIRSQNSWTADIVGNTVVGGIEVTSSEAGSRIEHNLVLGPATYGIRGRDTDGDVSVNHNIVRGAKTGINFYAGYVSRTIQGNEVYDCAEDGIVAEFVVGTGTVLDNVVLGCGGRGIVATMDGMFGSPVVVLRGNVVGRSGGDGAQVVATGGAVELERNTAYANGGDGFDVASDLAAAVTGNLAAGNAGFGLRAGVGVSALSCNDWFSNVLGATSGVVPGPDDLDVNPEFCDLAADVVTLAATSPLASGPCAIVGARGVGCAGVVGVDDAETSGPRFLASPSPSSASVTFAFPRAAAAARLEVFDATGARRRSAPLAAGATGWHWDLRDDSGHELPVGVYFARWSSGDERLVTRVVIAR